MPAATPTLSQLVGQRLVVAFKGTTASRSLRARIRAGQIGGVILFGSNIASPSQLQALTAKLQLAAHNGGQPPLLITTDQEGGLVKRIPWAPPNHSAQQLGQLPTAQSHTAGSLTGAALRADGVNIDLAPVADVPTGPSDFIEQQQRAFSTSRFIVAKDASAFADGLEGHKVWPTLKHFPGLGRATVSTDDALVHITATAQQLGRAWLPYKVAFRQNLDPMVMLSTAVYPALDRRAAAWSPAVIKGILRKRLGIHGCHHHRLAGRGRARPPHDRSPAGAEERGGRLRPDPDHRLAGLQPGRVQGAARRGQERHAADGRPQQVIRPHRGAQGPALAPRRQLSAAAGSVRR